MSLVSGTMVFFVIWWIVLFMVLPFGVSMEETPHHGFETGAPKNPNLGRKFLVTTMITTLIWGIIQFIMINQLVVFT